LVTAPGSRCEEVVPNTGLAGRTILIVEDEPLIALDIRAAFELVGADVVTASTLVGAIDLVEQDGLSGAVLDFGLRDGDADALCRRLRQRAIPFILHSGYTHLGATCDGGIVIPKPAQPEALVDALLKVLQ
jgi:DNA-binding response OmpR family regulator